LSWAVRLPQKKPPLELLFPQPERQVLHGHGTGIRAWSTDDCFPKACDDLQVTTPIFYLGIKYRADERILTNVSIEMA
jgi:hypothetical protein